MPFEIAEIINKTEKLLEAPIVHTIAKNPIYTAFIITVIIILIILFVFRDAETDDHLVVMSLRAGFWIFISMVGAIFLHNKVLATEVDHSMKIGAFDDVFKGPSIGSMEDFVVPVNINTIGTNQIQGRPTMNQNL